MTKTKKIDWIAIFSSDFVMLATALAIIAVSGTLIYAETLMAQEANERTQVYKSVDYDSLTLKLPQIDSDSDSFKYQKERFNNFKQQAHALLSN